MALSPVWGHFIGVFVRLLRSLLCFCVFFPEQTRASARGPPHYLIVIDDETEMMNANPLGRRSC